MKSCFTCKHRSPELKNQWNATPSYECHNNESWRFKRLVLKGMTCCEYEPNKSWKGKAA